MTYRDDVAEALKRTFRETIEASSGEPFEKAGVRLPSDEVWLRYADAAVEAFLEKAKNMDYDAGRECFLASNWYGQDAFQ